MGPQLILSLLFHAIALRSVVGIRVANPNRANSRAPVSDKNQDGPWAMGCYRTEDDKPSLPDNSYEDREGMTLATCVDHCGVNERTLAGVQDGYKCWCSDKNPVHPIQASSFCMTTCTGSTERCGGRNTISVYAICPRERYGPHCELACYCYNSQPCNLVTGYCLNEKCQSLYKGNRCDEEATSFVTSIIYKAIGFIKTAWKFVKSYFVINQEKVPEYCDANSYGAMCENQCHCIDNGHCDRVTGVCPDLGCALGWLGKRCNLGDPCKSSPCENSGNCSTVGLKFKCDCPRQYSGPTCKFANRCYNNPCQNDGTCKPKSMGRYTCECQGDFFGDDCQYDASKLPETHKYMGCFREYEKKLAIPTQMAGYEANNMTIGKCARKCKSKAFTYAGLKRGQECWCSNSIGLHGALPEADCKETCSGNEDQMCGGHDDTSVSVYTVCPVGFYKTDCKGMCNCLYEQCRQDNGKCEQNICKVGWEGERCEHERGESNQSLREAIKNILYILVTYAVLSFSGSFANGFKHLQETAAAKKRMETFKEARINQEMEKIKAEMKKKEEDKKKQIKEMKQKKKELAKKKEMKKKDKGKNKGDDEDGSNEPD